MDKQLQQETIDTMRVLNMSIVDLMKSVDLLRISLEMDSIQFNYQDLPPHLKQQSM